ncbi:3-hydroxybutyrate dehydrogenase [Sphingomonas jaspsi]|uniref:3-hydroxybutyrate dehydrogenase n=1 Tax=Sphingomonas jaspsi TaxID=392409 RepID=UPI00068547AB
MDMPTTQTRATADRPLDGQVAIVTGSTSGIGLGIARAFAAGGASVVINGIADQREIDRLCSECEGLGHSAVYDGANLMDPVQASGLVSNTLDRFGRVDILVNNAGIQHVSPIEEFPVDKWDAIIALNLSATFHTIRAALPGMKARGRGRIINVASAHALVASPFKSAYVAAKHGVLGLTKTVGLEAAREGVTCNAICPGYVWTPLVEKQIDDTAKARGISREEVIENVLLAAQPSKKFATVEELGALAVFLASDMGASINGTALSVDGGWVAQ